ncbi:MAG: glycoside hydrolase family 2 TIM barrel-domain containing protein [Planctomycetota bacterium]|jgi:hypothetical protein
MTSRTWISLLPLIVLPTVFAKWGGSAEVNHYEIVKKGDSWQLLQNGQPLYIKGAVGWQHFDVLKQRGGNSLRTRASKANLDRAHEHGLVVMAGLPIRGERNGMDWADPERVAEQKGKALGIVEQLKDHPALMLWVVGNELDWIPPGIAHHPRLWQHLNDLAVAIHRIDPHHPVLTVVGTGRYEQKIQQIAESCTDMDLLGVNSYGDIEKVVRLTRAHWPKAYLIAEWGPTGHWQVPKTEWRVPLEQTSTQKALAILDRYQRTIQADTDRCLGSYVFLWGQKQETTHTWYGMFQNGLLTQSVDVMQYVWTGTWPANRAPVVGRMFIEGFNDERSVYLAPGQACRVEIECDDPDGDKLTFAWDVRPEVEIPANSYAGGSEKPAKPIDGLVREPFARQARFAAPKAPGPYRIFVRVFDGHGHLGYGNVPFYVRE